MDTYVNGKLVSPAATHRLFSEFIEMQERFESKRGVATAATRAKLIELSNRLGAQAKRLYLERSPLAGTVMNRYVRLEEELSAMASDMPLAESFHARSAEWSPSEDRLDGDSEELEASALEAEQEAVRLRFKLHAIRKSTANKVELAKAGLVPRFSWAAAWASTKAKMRELGAEIRKEEAWARAARRELLLREREVEAQDKPFGCGNSDGSHLFPTEEDEAKRRCASRGERW